MPVGTRTRRRELSSTLQGMRVSDAPFSGDSSQLGSTPPEMQPNNRAMTTICGLPFPDSPTTKIKMSELEHVCNGGQIHSTTAQIDEEPLNASSEEDLVGAMVKFEIISRSNPYPLPDKAIIIVGLAKQKHLHALLRKLERGKGNYLIAEHLTSWREKESELWMVRGLSVTQIKENLARVSSQQPESKPEVERTCG